MPRLTQIQPSYRLHKKSGQAVVTLSGKDFYLGPYGSKPSKAEYDRVLAEWLAEFAAAQGYEFQYRYGALWLVSRVDPEPPFIDPTGIDQIQFPPGS